MAIEEHDNILQQYPVELPYHPIKFTEHEMLKRSQLFYEQMKSRRSVRCFSSRPVSIKLVQNLIKTAGQLKKFLMGECVSGTLHYKTPFEQSTITIRVAGPVRSERSSRASNFAPKKTRSAGPIKITRTSARLENGNPNHYKFQEHPQAGQTCSLGPSAQSKAPKSKGR